MNKGDGYVNETGAPIDLTNGPMGVSGAIHCSGVSPPMNVYPFFQNQLKSLPS